MSNVSHHMRVEPKRIASALFLCSALGPLGVWLILLFGAVPAHQSALQHAAYMAAFAFSESQAPWFFALLALLPLVFIFLAVAAWRAPADAWRIPSKLTLLAAAGVALALVVTWEVIFLAATAIYLLVRHRDG